MQTFIKLPIITPNPPFLRTYIYLYVVYTNSRFLSRYCYSNTSLASISMRRFLVAYRVGCAQGEGSNQCRLRSNPIKEHLKLIRKISPILHSEIKKLFHFSNEKQEIAFPKNITCSGDICVQ